MRTTHGPASKRRHKKILGFAKGFWGRRSKHYRRAIETVRRAWVYAYHDRRMKKRNFRALWINRLNAAARNHGLTYGELIHLLKVKEISLSRDMLAKVAAEYPEAFDKIVALAKEK